MEPLSNSTPCSRQPKANGSRRRNKRSPGAVCNIKDVNARKAIDTHAVKQAATKSSQPSKIRRHQRRNSYSCVLQFVAASVISIGLIGVLLLAIEIILQRCDDFPLFAGCALPLIATALNWVADHIVDHKLRRPPRPRSNVRCVRCAEASRLMKLIALFFAALTLFSLSLNLTAFTPLEVLVAALIQTLMAYSTAVAFKGVIIVNGWNIDCGSFNCGCD